MCPDSTGSASVRAEVSDATARREKASRFAKSHSGPSPVGVHPEVGDPRPVRCGRREVALEQVRGERDLGSPAPEAVPPRADARDVDLTRSAARRACAHVDAFAFQGRVDARRAVAPAGIWRPRRASERMPSAERDIDAP
jgi:hypothetical protein